MRRRLKILFTNLGLTIGTGTEIVVRDLALGLRALGHEPMIYAPRTGELFDELLQSGICVVSDLHQLTSQPDVIHGHHHVETVQACDRFPGVPAIFVVHDRTAYFDFPPDHRQIRRYVAVDYNCMERIANGNYPAMACVIPNAVDLRRFRQRPPLPSQPERALIFSNYARAGGYIEVVTSACRAKGIHLDVIGVGVEHVAPKPEALVGQYDLVFAKGRAALESLAVGTAVILCDTSGAGKMVDSSSVKDFRHWNFGMRLLSHPITEQRIIDEIDRYDAEDARIVSDYIRAHASLRDMLERYLQLYHEVIGEHKSEATTKESLENPLSFAYPEPYHNLERVLQLRQRLELSQRTSKSERLVSLPLPIEPGQIAVTMGEIPPQIEHGKTCTLCTRIYNRSPHTLGEFPPYPVRLSYYWLSNSGERLPEPDWIRTLIQQPIRPQEQASIYMQVKAPDKQGVYRLRVTLVQEWYRWFDEPPLSIYADIILTVL